jgi:hypothetical protein
VELKGGTKLGLFHSNVKSFLLYSCEMWKASKTITRQVQVFINKCLRRILCIFWPVQISNNGPWTVTNQIRIDLEIWHWKWGWLGHTLRKLPNEIAWLALDWNLQGRPKVAWRRTVLEEAKIIGKVLERDHTARSIVRFLDFPLSVSFHPGSPILIHILPGG